MLVATACGSGEPSTTETVTESTTTPVDAPEPTDLVAAADVPAPDTAASTVVPAVTAEPEVSTAPLVVDPLPVHVEGHRGARGLKPENTLQAFETALDIGVSTLELDMHLTADGAVIVWHDANLGADKCRFSDTNREFPAAGVPVASLTSVELADYQCDLNPNTDLFPDQNNNSTEIAGDDYQPVTLAAVFDFVEVYANSPDKTDEQRARAAVVEFNIETKRDISDPAAIGDDFDGVNPGAFELQTLAVVEAADVADRVVIQSFDHRSLWAIRSVDPDIRLAALTSGDSPDLDEMSLNGANIWSPNFNVMTKELVDQAHALGLLVIPWTVNDAESMQMVIANGADGFITDRPDIAAVVTDSES